jgi:hypothetical protein
MQRFGFIIIYLLAIAGCHPDDNGKTSAWLIGSSTSEAPLFRKGTVMVLKKDSILFTMQGEKMAYPAIIGNGRLLFNDGKTKWLFSMEVDSSGIKLSELYSRNPVIIRLTGL